VLRVEGVHRRFGTVEAVAGVSFEVAPGSAFALLGPNGAGKTTTMRMILGIVAPDDGRISWHGRPIDAEGRRRFGYLPEERGLYGRLRVREHLAYFGRLHGLSKDDAARRADAWIERLELGEHARRRCAELSKGNQQKVQVACAILHLPELAILDEPFSGLDPHNAETLSTLLRELRAAGTTMVLSSHQLWQIELLCDHFCIMADGRVRALGTLEELRSARRTRVVEVAPPAPALARVLDAEPGARQLPHGDGVLTYELPVEVSLAALLRRLVAAGEVTRFAPLEPSLHDIYLRATGAPAA
jgi:ABC-2 type transport system ATP-binding protein